MKRIIIIISLVVMGVLCYWGFLYVASSTTQLIEKTHVDEYGRGLALVGGEFSHADTMYIDHRPTLENKENPSDVWMAKGNEWRRLESRRYNGYTSTVVVLREQAVKSSRFGVSRDDPAAKAYQEKFDRIVAEYQAQSIFDRVWWWRVQDH